MAYSSNPNIPKVRWDAVKMLRSGKSSREVARYFGYDQSTIIRWAKQAEHRNVGPIPTLSSKPHYHPKALSRDIVSAIIDKRLEHDRCGQVVHHELTTAGMKVSLSSVQRTLDRCHLTKKRSPWKRPHDHTRRPEAAYPGAFVEIDTIHLQSSRGERVYVYTAIDLCSRWSFAWATDRIGAKKSVEFMRRVRESAPFEIRLVQSDNGPEFTTGFTHAMKRIGISHRHSRERRSNDQAHVERFNRTIQEECLDFVPRSVSKLRNAISKYLPYYNGERIHMGIGYQTPEEVMQRY
ncbi:MAG: transposase family protein [Candidatus Moranbacteria bacterium]|nr:transposase family protein [Candidatus Moranbacteria bacterium]NTW45865.1 transposase family protein [Candidatus Moranbacteria bacterium]